LRTLLERVADTVPDHLALVCGPRRLTYADLDARANRLAHVLQAHGVGPGDHVALYLYNSTEYLEGMLAAFKDPRGPDQRELPLRRRELRYLLDDADAVAVVFHREFASKLEAIRPNLPPVAHLRSRRRRCRTRRHPRRHRGPSTTRTRWPTRRRFATSPPARPTTCTCWYTGGTTGMPKGVMWRHVDLFFGAMAGAGGGGTPIATPEEIEDRCRQPRTRCVPICPFMHGTAHWMAFSSLFMAAPSSSRPSTGSTRSRCGAWSNASRRTTSSSSATPSRARCSYALDSPRWVRAIDASSLQVVLSGGAVLSPSLKRAFVDRLPSLLVVDGYGASETGGQGQSVVVAGGEVPSAPRFRVGDDTQVLDADLRPAAIGVVGRLARRGHIPLGYYNDPVKTAETFPVVDGVRWAVPGDHAVVEADGIRSHCSSADRLFDQHRRRKGLSRRGRVGAEGPRRRIRRTGGRRRRRPLG